MTRILRATASSRAKRPTEPAAPTISRTSPGTRAASSTARQAVSPLSPTVVSCDDFRPSGAIAILATGSADQRTPDPGTDRGNPARKIPAGCVRGLKPGRKAGRGRTANDGGVRRIDGCGFRGDQYLTRRRDRIAELLDRQVLDTELCYLHGSHGTLSR